MSTVSILSLQKRKNKHCRNIAASGAWDVIAEHVKQRYSCTLHNTKLCTSCYLQKYQRGQICLDHNNGELALRNMTKKLINNRYRFCYSVTFANQCHLSCLLGRVSLYQNPFKNVANVLTLVQTFQHTVRHSENKYPPTYTIITFISAPATKRP